MKRNNYIFHCILLACSLFFITSCDDESTDGASLKNNCIKRTVGPHVWGLDIEFAYAMAIPRELGRIVLAQVEASIPGASETYLEHHSYHTKQDGLDSAVVVGKPSQNIDNITKVEFTVDTCAATLRYFYRIPEEAKGKNVTFTFSATASNGETVSMKMGEYVIAAMDMKLDLGLRQSTCYISIEDMAAYNAATAITIPEKIDLVFFFKEDNDVKINHCFVTPAVDEKYLFGFSVPAELKRNTKIREVGIKDAHLARLHLKPQPESQPAIFIDDIDIRDMPMENMPNWALDVVVNDGMFVETEDGKYRAYIFVNSLDRRYAGGTISIKRLTMY